MPKPPPRSSSGSCGAGALGEVGMQAEGTPGRDLEAIGVEDLRSDVGVDPDQVQRRMVRTGGERRRRVAAGDGEAELLIFVGGRDVLVGVRLDPGGGSHHDPCPDPPLGGQGAEPVDLGEGVDDDPADPGVERLGQLGDALVVAVQTRPGPCRSPPAAQPRARRRCRRRCRVPPRSPNGRPRCRGTTCRRSRRPSRRTPRRRRGPGPAGRPRPARTPGYRRSLPARWRGRPPRSGRRPHPCARRRSTAWAAARSRRPGGSTSPARVW